MAAPSRARACACCLLLALAAAVPGWSAKVPLPGAFPEGEDLQQNLASFTQLEILIQRKMFLTEDGIEILRRYSQSLDPFYRDVLYERYSKGAWSAAGMNFLTGGLGSFLMNDVVAGIVLETGMTLSYGLIIYAMTNPAFRSQGGLIWGEVGATVFGVAGLVWPFLTALPWNAKLKRSLGY